ncbi:uroporphyrinogen III methyltransferase [Bacteroidia bacterium]|nr:uroporphyrinogen III methyltransferase [Bacteroidia bacterium]
MGNIKKILVSQPKPAGDKSPYYDIAEKYGVEVVFRPFVKVDPVDLKDFRSQRINLLDFSAVVFTAKTGVDHFFRIVKETRVYIPETMKYFCVTEAIAAYLQKYIIYRKRKIFFPLTGKMTDLAIQIGKHNKENYLVIMSDVHKDDLLLAMDAKRIKHKEAVMYRTVSNDFAPDEPFDYDVLLFFSPSGINSLLKNFPEFKQGNIAIGTFGPTTAKAATEAGLHLHIEAPAPEAPSMVAALENFLKKAASPKKKK